MVAAPPTGMPPTADVDGSYGSDDGQLLLVGGGEVQQLPVVALPNDMAFLWTGSDADSYLVHAESDEHMPLSSAVYPVRSEML